MTSRERNDKIIAVVATLLIAVALCGVLIVTKVGYMSAPEMAETATPELAPADEEETFLEPLLTEVGEEDATENDAPEASPLGTPIPAETDNNKLTTDKKPQTESTITQKKESPVKGEKPAAVDKEAQAIQKKMAGKFDSKADNGTADGKAGAKGTGTGIGIKGTATGREFIGCDKPSVSLRNKTVVKVSVIVNEAGRVTSAHATGTSDKTILKACERAAMTARWKEKKGATETHGTITFTITPK